MSKIIKGLMLATVILNTIGCASYYSHYGSFSAQNSTGEERMFVISWQTAEYPAWALQNNKSTEMVLETQCSDRKWRIADRAALQSHCNEVNGGIVACGDPSLDLSLSGKKLAGSDQVCLSVSDTTSSTSIAELDRHILITVNCLPVSSTHKQGDDIKNVDYLKASVVPYSVSTRKVERYSFSDKAPIISDKVCAAEK